MNLNKKVGQRPLRRSFNFGLKNSQSPRLRQKVKCMGACLLSALVFTVLLSLFHSRFLRRKPREAAAAHSQHGLSENRSQPRLLFEITYNITFLM